jgi:WD40 repeat protein
MSKKSVYTVGGTVQAGGGLYIGRSADEELLKLCREGTFAYVLSSRQVGKSSLMVGTSEQLIEEGIRPVIIDLTQIGVQLTPEAWYFGLITTVADELELDTDIVSWWESHSNIGVTQRLTLFFEEILLKEISEKVIIFVDEIDTTLSLDFTDDFFAAIRYLYNARANVPQFERLSFVLIGVATPSDLMSDPHRTPFNIGQQVDLSDFTLEQALPLAAGLGPSEDEAREALGWVLKWTGGHPYLTQRLCRIIEVQSQSTWSEKDVDTAVASTFFGRASEQDSNLQFVRDMLTKWAPDRLQVLTAYRQIRLSGKPVPDEEQSAIKNHLKLSGIARREGGHLQVRNPIYEQVFDRAWLKAHWPTNWLSTVPTSVKVASVASFIMLIISASLAVYALNLAQEKSLLVEREQQAITDLQQALTREQELRRLEQQARSAADEAQSQALEEEQKAKQLAEAEQQARIEASTSRDLAQLRETEAISARDSAETRRIEVERLRRIDIARFLTTQAPLQQQAGNDELGTLLARQAYLWSQGELPNEVYNALRETLNAPKFAAGGPVILRGHTDAVRSVTYSPDASIIASGGADGTLRLWSKQANYAEPTVVNAHKGSIRRILFSADGQMLISAGDDGIIRLWNAERIDSGATEVRGHSAGVWALAISVDTQFLFSGGADRNLIAWKLDGVTAQQLYTLPLSSRITTITCRQDGKTVAVGCDDGTLQIYSISDDNAVQESIIRLKSSVESAAFNPAGTRLVAGDGTGRIEVYALNQKTGNFSSRTALLGHVGPVNSIAFSQEGNKIISGSSDKTIRQWDLTNPERDPVILNDHQSWVLSVAISPRGDLLISGSADRTIRVWNVSTGNLAERVCSVVERNLSQAEWNEFIGGNVDYVRTCPNLPAGEGIQLKTSNVSH